MDNSGGERNGRMFFANIVRPFFARRALIVVPNKVRPQVGEVH